MPQQTHRGRACLLPLAALILTFNQTLSCSYGLGKREAESYVLCDTIGSIADHQWKTEGFRVVGDNEKPLLLQSLWKPREGLARRFELQKKSSVEEKTARDKDTITAGTMSDCMSSVCSSLCEKQHFQS